MNHIIHRLSGLALFQAIHQKVVLPRKVSLMASPLLHACSRISVLFFLESRPLSRILND